jgi:hypothetical protein
VPARFRTPFSAAAAEGRAGSTQHRPTITSGTGKDPRDRVRPDATFRAAGDAARKLLVRRLQPVPAMPLYCFCVICYLGDFCRASELAMMILRVCSVLSGGCCGLWPGLGLRRLALRAFCCPICGGGGGHRRAANTMIHNLVNIGAGRD